MQKVKSYAKCIINEFSAKSGDPRQQFRRNEDVLQFTETLEFDGKDKVNKFAKRSWFLGTRKRW